MRRPPETMKSSAIAYMLYLWLAAAPAFCGEFTVNPIRLDLDSTVRSSAITVKNEDQKKISFQVRAMEWTQDTDGRDQYRDTRELVYFPRVMTTEAGEARVIRIGTKFPLVPKEKAYRLFIEELPEAAGAGTDKRAQVNMLIRFGAPIFVKPLKPEDHAEVENIEMTHGELALLARNSGNEHLVVEGINLTGVDVQGHEVYALTIADRYLLAGAIKRYSTVIPQDQCEKIADLAIEFKTDKVTLRRKLEVSRAMCR